MGPNDSLSPQNNTVAVGVGATSGGAGPVTGEDGQAGLARRLRERFRIRTRSHGSPE